MLVRQRCSACGELGKVKWCMACREVGRKVGYCSAECQKADRRAHRAVCGTFAVGAAVVVEGLASQTAYNGCGGRVIGALDATTGRYGVELDGDGRRLSLKPEKIRWAKGA